MWSLLQALLSSKSQETGALTSKGRRKWIISYSERQIHFLFYSDLSGWMMSTCIGEGSLLIQMQISFRDIPTDIPRNNVLPAIWPLEIYNSIKSQRKGANRAER